MPEPATLLHDPVWDRQYGESQKAYRAFQVYRDAGLTRTIADAYRHGTGRPEARAAAGTWTNWAAKWRWTDRAQAWDKHLEDEVRAEQEAAARREGQALADQRRQQRAKELDLGNRLIQKAEEILQMPTVEVTTERDTATGHLVQTFKPGRWRIADAAAIARMGVELKRLGLGMETSRTTVQHEDIEDEIRRMARENGWDEDAAVETARRYADEHGDRGAAAS